MEKQSNACWQRIETLLKHADMSANYFAKYIGLARGGKSLPDQTGQQQNKHRRSAEDSPKVPEILDFLADVRGTGIDRQ